jgi:NAD(P)H-nitrite reductase large subunit
MSENIFLQKDYVIGVIDRMINSVRESNSYRGRVNQTAQFAVEILESVKNEIMNKSKEIKNESH